MIRSYGLMPIQQQLLSDCLDVTHHKDVLMESNASDADVIVVRAKMQPVISDAVLDKMPSLRHIFSLSVGTNHFDTKACEKRDIQLTNFDAYGPDGVGEQAMALLLAVSRGVVRTHKSIEEGTFQTTFVGRELVGKTLGIVGTGKIGMALKERAEAFGMKIIGHDVIFQKGITYVSLEELCSQADVISLHVPLFPETEHMINEKMIARMDGAIIINTARGELIDTKALLGGLENGNVWGAGLDVFENEGEYTPEFKQLLAHPNVVVTPHMGAATEDAQRRLVAQAVAAIKKVV